MNPLFTAYDAIFEKYKEMMQDEIPRTLRLFNIRFRLALDIEISFKGDVSLTKTTEVKETYKIIFQLLEKWNSYEAFTHYLKELKDYIKQKESI